MADLARSGFNDARSVARTDAQTHSQIKSVDKVELTASAFGKRNSSSDINVKAIKDYLSQMPLCSRCGNERCGNDISLLFLILFI